MTKSDRKFYAHTGLLDSIDAVLKVNDSIYQLYKPPGKPDEQSKPSIQVVFFHGFQLGDSQHSQHLSTWETRDGDSIWPQTWLVEEFPDAHILSVSYTAALKKSKASGPVGSDIISEKLMSDLLHAEIGQQPHCPVVLIGHSFGGLVMKQLCLLAAENGRDEHKKFLENLKGLFFYSTPHYGIPFMDSATLFVRESPLLEYVKALSSQATARLNHNFHILQRSRSWQIAGVGEALPTGQGQKSMIVVTEASSRIGDEFIVEEVDHISVCRPRTKNSRNFRALTRFLHGISGDSKIRKRYTERGNRHLVDKIKGILQTVTSLGIVGMGGIGKTTLAMALFNDLRNDFEYTCFVKDMKNMKGSIRDAMINHMHHVGKKLWRNNPPNEEKLLLLENVLEKPLLLILDDVETDFEILRMLWTDSKTHKYSRVIMTSREPKLLKNCVDAVYPISFLNSDDSEELFADHAFPEGVPALFETETYHVARKCEGLPLTLEVVGKYLHGRLDKEIWEQALQVLDEAKLVVGADERLWARLKLVYDGLDEEEQHMFRNAATRFYNKELDYAKKVWSITLNEHPDELWRHLVDLSLVWELPEDEYGEDNSDDQCGENDCLERGNKIGMHDQLLCLGRNIAATIEKTQREIVHSETGYQSWSGTEGPYAGTSGLEDRREEGQAVFDSIAFPETTIYGPTAKGKYQRRSSTLIRLAGASYHGLSWDDTESRYKRPLEFVALKTCAYMTPEEMPTYSPTVEEKCQWSFTRLTRLLGRFCGRTRSQNCNFTSYKILRIHDNFQQLPASIVGIDHVLEEAKYMLTQTTKLGFWGMGGIGKTTLVRALFNDLEQSYECTCFLTGVKHIQGSIMGAMLKELHHRGRKIPEKERSVRFLFGKRLFVVLDDVASEEDLKIVEFLRDSVVHAESLFVATTTNVKILKSCKFKSHSEILDVSSLDAESSKQLFLTHAFPKGLPPSFPKDIIDDIVQKCEGLPLTLEVVGKHLHGKLEKEIWEQALQVLDDAKVVVGVDERLCSKLKLVYDGLDEEEQHMFVDVATRFYKEDLASAMREWSNTIQGYPDELWQHLVDLSLVWEMPDDEYGQDDFIEKRTIIGMHDQLLCLGRNIAATSGETGRGAGDMVKGKERQTENCSAGNMKVSVARNVLKSDLHGIPSDGPSHRVLTLPAHRGSYSSPPKIAQPSTIGGRSHEEFLNDSLYQLYKPSGSISMQVLFFHGLQMGDNYDDAYLSTWKSGDNSCIWPQTWLVDEFPDAHILSVSYNASLTRNKEKGNMDIFLIGENLMSDLRLAKIGQDPNCPVVLVGHSVGGLVMKQICLQARNVGGSENNNFLRNVKGLFFYSTPHHGIRYVDFAAHFVSWAPLLDYVKILSEEGARLQFQFESLCKEDYISWQIVGVGENCPTNWGPFKLVVVPEASSRFGDEFSIVEYATHSTICRPREKYQRSFTMLTRLLGRFYSNLRIPDNFQHLPASTVGIDHILEETKYKLTQTTKLGFWGMGGIGKTTLAKALFNDLEHNYECTCFLTRVKHIQGSIKDAMLKELYHRGRQMPEKERSFRFLFGKRLFLVLDDVGSEEDLKIVEILRNYGVHAKSLFVATTRDAKILTSCKFESHSEIHDVSTLDAESSNQLFLMHAFPKGLPPSFPKNIVDDIVRKCEGLPLTLEVIGKHLHGETEEIWKEALEQLDEAKGVVGLEEKLWARLRLSYDGLDKVAKEMFLDAATTFHNSDLNLAKAAWSTDTGDSQHTRWKHLVHLSLVREFEYMDKFSGKHIGIGMHEQLLSLGKKIASTIGGNGLRIWDSKKGKELLLAENSGEHDIKDIIALKLIRSDLHIESDFHEENSSEDTASQTETRTSIPGSTLNKMEKLRYLLLDSVPIDPTHGATLPPTLVSLQLSAEEFTDIPFNPKDHNRTAVLILSGCDQLSTLPATFGLLSSLQMLHISGSPNLESLPDSLGRLAKLKYLEIDACRTLKKLPETLGKLAALEHLVLSDCTALSALPDSLGRLRTLRRLVIWRCDVSELPETFGNLTALEHLVVNCRALLALPDSLEHLERLQRMVIQECDLHQLPETIGKLEDLEDMTISQCEALSALPNSFGRLRRLQKLEIRGCGLLQKLPDTFLQLEGLEHIILRSTSLWSIPNLENLGSPKRSSLKTLQLQWEQNYEPRSPTLPTCLEEVINENNYLTRSFNFNVVGGKFILDEEESRLVQKVDRMNSQLPRGSSGFGPSTESLT